MTSKKPQQKYFDPADRSHRWKFWVAVDSRKGSYHHVYWGRLAAALGILGACGWLALSSAFWANLRYHRRIEEVRFGDLVAPWRWSRYKAAIGAHYLAQGRRDLEVRNPDAALYLFNAALALDPTSLEKRQLAAQAQYELGHGPAALGLLRAGLPGALAQGDEAYVRAFFDASLDQQDDDGAYSVGSRLLPPVPDTGRLHQLIAFEIATARYNRGHYLEAEKILSDWKLGSFPEAEALLAHCESEQGHPDAALRRLEADLSRFQQRDTLFVALERISRDLGRRAEVSRYALMREISEPAHPQTRIDVVYADRALGRDADVQREIDAYARDFGSDPAALALLAQYGADTGDPDTAERARDLAKAKGASAADFDLELAQASLVTRDYRRAIAAIDRAQQESAETGRQNAAVLAGVRTVARLGDRDPGADLEFIALLEEAPFLNRSAGLFIVDQLRRNGFAREGGKLLKRLAIANPDDQAILTEMILADADFGDRASLEASVPLLLEMRKPSHEALRACLRCLDQGRDGPLRTQITLALGDGPVGEVSSSP